jgi:hypothetical protein
MEHHLTQVDRFPVGTVIGVYERTQASFGMAPRGEPVTSVTMGPEGVTIVGLEERKEYSAYAQVDGYHRYTGFLSPAQGDFPPFDPGVAVHDEQSSGFAYAYPGTISALNPQWGLQWGTGLSLQEAQNNVLRGQELLEYAAEKGLVADFPAQWLTLASCLRPPDHSRFKGQGRRATVFTMHPDFAQNGPAIAHRVDDSGHQIEMADVMGRDFGINCRYSMTSQYLTKFQLTAPANFATAGTDTGDGSGSMHLPEISMIRTAGSDPSQVTALLFDVYDEVGDNVGRLESTSHDATKFYDVTFVAKSNSSPIDVPAGTMYRLAEVTAFGGIRIGKLDTVMFSGVRVEDTNGYSAGFEGYLYESADGSHNKVNLIMFDCELDGSYGSDGVDAKDLLSAVFLHVKSSNHYDKGLNTRSIRNVFFKCESWGNGANYQFQSSYAVSPTANVKKLLGTAISAAPGQTINLTSATGWGTSGYGWIGASEYAHYTRAGLVVTWDRRGLAGTRAVAHPAATGSLPIYAVPVTGGTDNTPPTDPADSTVSMIDCHGWAPRGSNVVIGGTGTGRIHAQIDGGSFRTGNRGITTGTGYRPVTCVVTGGCEITDNVSDTDGWGSGGGIFARATRLIVDSTVVIDRNGGHGIELLGCIDCRIEAIPKGNGGFGLKTASCEFLEWNGRVDMSNASGAYSIATMKTFYGTAFGLPSETFEPTVYQEAFPLAAASGTPVAMASGTAYGQRFRLAGPLKIARLWARVEAGNNSTTQRMALAVVNADGTATIVAVGNNNTSLFGAIGGVRPPFSAGATYWGYAGLDVVVFALRAGGSAPSLAVRAGKLTATASSPRRPQGVTASVADFAVGDTLTLTESANEPYVGVEAG